MRGAQLVLLVDEGRDVLEDALVTHGKAPGGSAHPTPVPSAWELQVLTFGSALRAAVAL
jgi:hypothetical protein